MCKHVRQCAEPVAPGCSDSKRPTRPAAMRCGPDQAPGPTLNALTTIIENNGDKGPWYTVLTSTDAPSLVVLQMLFVALSLLLSVTFATTVAAENRIGVVPPSPEQIEAAKRMDARISRHDRDAKRALSGICTGCEPPRKKAGSL
jgi:hypothetical protein